MKDSKRVFALVGFAVILAVGIFCSIWFTVGPGKGGQSQDAVDGPKHNPYTADAQYLGPSDQPSPAPTSPLHENSVQDSSPSTDSASDPPSLDDLLKEELKSAVKQALLSGNNSKIYEVFAEFGVNSALANGFEVPEDGKQELMEHLIAASGL